MLMEMKKNKIGNKILILVGGGIKHISPFIKAGEKLGVDVSVGSFAKLEYKGSGESVKIYLDGVDIADYDVVYLRLVGRRYEDAALVVKYAKENGIKLVDSIYERGDVIRLPIPKSIETKLLMDAGVPTPKTYFGRTKMMKKYAVEKFGYPFVIKGTMGKQGHAVWSPRNEEELDELIEKFTPVEKKEGVRFLAQEFIKASQRNRVFVIGDKAVEAITRPTRWRKRFIKKVDGEFPEGKRKQLSPVPKEDAELAVKASKAVGIEIGGVDVLTEDKTGKKYILEVNSAPRWAALKKDTGIDVEKEIVKYLANL